LAERVAGAEVVVGHVRRPAVVAPHHRGGIAPGVAGLVGQDQLQVIEVRQVGGVVEPDEDGVPATIEAAVALRPPQP
ncbi:hypothetical protein DF186_25735, partial [Enterococcus hirae]